LMQFSNERINTGIEEIDAVFDELNQTVDNFELLQEGGDSVILETNEITPLVLENYSQDNDRIDVDNDKFDVGIENILDFSERNPFGEAYR
jgi:hypothetical protein